MNYLRFCVFDIVFTAVKEHGEEQPRSIPPVMFLYCLSTLREKGLVEFKTNYDEVIKASKTLDSAIEMARNSVYDNARYLGRWKGFDVYEPIF